MPMILAFFETQVDEIFRISVFHIGLLNFPEIFSFILMVGLELLRLPAVARILLVFSVWRTAHRYRTLSIELPFFLA